MITLYVVDLGSKSKFEVRVKSKSSNAKSKSNKIGLKSGLEELLDLRHYITASSIIIRPIVE